MEEAKDIFRNWSFHRAVDWSIECIYVRGHMFKLITVTLINGSLERKVYLITYDILYDNL